MAKDLVIGVGFRCFQGVLRFYLIFWVYCVLSGGNIERRLDLIPFFLVRPLYSSL